MGRGLKKRRHPCFISLDFGHWSIHIHIQSQASRLIRLHIRATRRNAMLMQEHKPVTVSVHVRGVTTAAGSCKCILNGNWSRRIAPIENDTAGCMSPFYQLSNGNRLASSHLYIFASSCFCSFLLGVGLVSLGCSRWWRPREGDIELTVSSYV